MAIDPVCQMEVDQQSAAGQCTYEGKTYLFCSAGCLENFQNNPGRYLPKDADRPGQQKDPGR